MFCISPPAGFKPRLEFLVNFLTRLSPTLICMGSLKHPSELYPRVGFIVTNLERTAERVVAFYDQRGTAEQCIKEGKGAIKWTRLSCHSSAANAVRLQLHALVYNLGNFMRTLAMPKAAEPWSLTRP
jgi:hypothetical protein